MPEVSPKPQVTIFFDATCQLCSREIEHYHRIDTAHGLAYVDITDPNFDAGSYGLNAAAVQRVMHVQLDSGAVVTGVDAFLAIWSVIPRYRRLVPVARMPGVNALMRAGYSIFAAIRPYLPKRARGSCALGACPARSTTT